MPRLEAIDIATLGREILDFSTRLDSINKSEQVLNGLHEVTSKELQLNVLGALMLPVRWSDWGNVQLGKSVFLHSSVPKGWWDEYFALVQNYPAPGINMAQFALAPFTMSELMKMLEPLGVERWPIELAMKHGIRDSFNCPIGGRWVVTFWSKKVLSQPLTPQIKAIVFMGATFAAIRLQTLAAMDESRVGDKITLTPRELSVLRLLSIGKQLRETAELLGLGEETVRSHLKKAYAKLGVQNRTHAVSQALRYRLIP